LISKSLGVSSRNSSPAAAVAGQQRVPATPLIQFAGRQLRIDQELACDAAVMRRHPKSRKLYARTMLKTQLAEAALPLGCHWNSAVVMTFHSDSAKALSENQVLMEGHVSFQGDGWKFTTKRVLVEHVSGLSTLKMDSALVIRDPSASSPNR
jgi:hypothetical protein